MSGPSIPEHLAVLKQKWVYTSCMPPCGSLAPLTQKAWYPSYPPLIYTFPNEDIVTPSS